MRLVWSFIFGTACITFSLVLVFQLVTWGDVVRYCMDNNLVLVDEMCSESMFDYIRFLSIYAIGIGAAGILMISSVFLAPDLPNFDKGEGLKI